MREFHRSVSLAAGTGAVCLLGGAGFVPGGSALGGPRAPLQQHEALRTAASSAPAACGGASACAAAASLAAAGTFVAGAVGKSRRRQASRVQAAAKVLTTDSSGRFRFVTPTAPTVQAAAKVLTTDSSGRFRFVAPTSPAAVLEPSEQLGVCAPAGFFDPLGFSKRPLMTFPDDPTGFKWLREAELKHGRFCMIATFGTVYAHYFKFEPGFDDVPTGLAALTTAKGAGGALAIACCIGLFEIQNYQDEDDIPGSYGDPLKAGDFSDEMRLKELNNGRLGMIAWLGQVFVESQTGLDPIAALQSVQAP